MLEGSALHNTTVTVLLRPFQRKVIWVVVEFSPGLRFESEVEGELWVLQEYSNQKRKPPSLKKANHVLLRTAT